MQGMEDIISAMGGREEGSSGSQMPKKRKVYVNEDVYNRLMSNGEATDAESDVDQMPEDPLGEKRALAQTDPANDKSNLSGEDEEMPEGIEFEGMDDDEDDSVIKRLGKLFGAPKAKMKGY